MHVGDRRDDPRNQLVLQLENRFRAESALVVLGPEMSAGHRIHELHRDAQPRSRLAEAALHHIARAQLFADGSHIAGSLEYVAVELRAITLR